MKNNGHDSRAVANIFVRKAQDAGDDLTIMALLKFVYFAHGWTLGYTKQPLICHAVEAWKHGPVVPEVYEIFRPQGILVREIVQQYSVPGIGDLSATERKIINGVYVSYSPLDPFRLSHITHGEGTPWAKYNKRYYATIPNEEIAEYYQTIVRENRGNV